MILVGPKDKLTIGLVVEDIYTDFSKEIIRSIVYAIHGRKNMRFVLIAGRQFENDAAMDNQHLYKLVYNKIYDIVGACELDGMVVALPNMKGVKYDRFPGVPKVFIACDDPDEVTINYNDEMGVREALGHLLDRLGYTRLCMLGGRDDNADAQKRKRIFMDCLKERNIEYSESMYEPTGMIIKSEKAAASLLERNPDTQAIFCVNDQVAVGLYEIMKTRDLVPGRDVAVFGFDNTRLATEMIPPLASIGSDAATLGKSALDELLHLMNNEPASSVTVPTRLFGRESFYKNMYQYSRRQIIGADAAFISELFDDCFYRYRNEITDNREIDLRRLYYEFMSRMIDCIRKKRMSEKRYDEICHFIDVFFDNDAMKYTDTSKFIKCMENLNEAMKGMFVSPGVNNKVNRLFMRMKDKSLRAQTSWWNGKNAYYNRERANVCEFMADVMDFNGEGHKLEKAVQNFNKLGLKYATVYLYKDPVICEEGKECVFPEKMYKKCMILYNELIIVPPEEQECLSRDLFTDDMMARDGWGQIAYPLFGGNRIYGVLVSGVGPETNDRGEYIAAQFSRALDITYYG